VNVYGEYIYICMCNSCDVTNTPFIKMFGYLYIIMRLKRFGGKKNS